MDELIEETVLAGASVQRKTLQVVELAAFGLVRLQACDRTERGLAVLSEQLGLTLPGPGLVLDSQEGAWFWTAPGEWLVAVTAGAEEQSLSALRSRLGSEGVACSIVTDSHVVLEISGVAAREVLARGSTVDFHPVNFPTGKCLLTQFAGLPVLLATLPGRDTFILFADRSVGQYLIEWFKSASSDC